MSNNKLPNEIYLLGQDLEYMVEDGQKDLYHIDASLTDVLGRQIKYLSEESVKEMLSEKDKEIERLKEKISYYEGLAKSAEELAKKEYKDIDEILTPIGLISGTITLNDLEP